MKRSISSFILLAAIITALPTWGYNPYTTPYHGAPSFNSPRVHTWSSQAINIRQSIANNGDYVITIHRSGNTSDNLQLGVNGRSLRIQMEMSNRSNPQVTGGGFFRSYNRMLRTIRLPMDADVSKITTRKTEYGMEIIIPRYRW